jgi:pyridoxamine 5'-phosphate oxidase-like protein
MGGAWPDDVDEVLTGDLTTAIAYVTPAGGAVPTAVAPLGLRDRERGTITFTTSLGFGRKLDRLRRDPRIALAYHAREHGFAEGNPRYVLVQGDVRIVERPDRAYLDDVIAPAAERFMGPPRRGAFWDRWLQAYYADRVPVEVEVTRIVVWPDLRCAGTPEVLGEPLPAEPPAPQKEPAKGSGPRLDSQRALRRMHPAPHRLLAFRGADGRPVVLPVELEQAGPEGIALRSAAPLPPGGRRAGLLAHRYNAKLIGLLSRVHTGWLAVDGGRALYAPHTESGFRAPANKTLLLLGNGYMARRGLKKARAAG